MLDGLPNSFFGIRLSRSGFPMWPSKVHENFFPWQCPSISINWQYCRAAYDLTITNPKCYSQFKLFQIVLYQAVLIFVCDVIILLAPMPILCQLNMPTRKTVALMAIFGTGLCTPGNIRLSRDADLYPRYNRLYRPRRPLQHVGLSAQRHHGPYL